MKKVSTKQRKCLACYGGGQIFSKPWSATYLLLQKESLLKLIRLSVSFECFQRNLSCKMLVNIGMALKLSSFHPSLFPRIEARFKIANDGYKLAFHNAS